MVINVLVGENTFLNMTSVERSSIFVHSKVICMGTFSRQAGGSEGSWSVVLSNVENCLIISTTDYHAEPLKLPLARLGMVTKFSAESEPRDETVKDDRPSDQHEIGRQNRYVLISKKEKCLYIAARDANDAPLKLSRKELHAIGKMMSKRVKRGRKPLV